MANITFTVPDAVVPRIRAAFGRNGTSATVAEVQAVLKSYIQGTVAQYEAGLLSASTVSNVSQESW